MEEHQEEDQQEKDQPKEDQQEKEQQGKERVTIQEYLEKIVDLHSLPCLVLLRINTDAFIVEAVAASTEAMSLVLAQKDEDKNKMEYVG